MADLVDRFDRYGSYISTDPVFDPLLPNQGTPRISPGVSGEILPSPLALDMPDDELLAENASLREELRALRLHLEMAHECCFPKGEGDG